MEREKKEKQRERMEREKYTMMKQSVNNVKSRLHRRMLYKHDTIIQMVYVGKGIEYWERQYQNEATSAKRHACICNNN